MYLVFFCDVSFPNMVLLSILIVFVHIERQLAFVMSLPDASIVPVTEILFVT